jgi:phosphatidylglycerophosphate synthase
MRDYAYQCKDYSLLTPAFKRLCVTPLLKFIPWGLPANIITIVSNAFFYVALYFSFDQNLLGRWNFVVIPFLLMAYLIGDHLDGAQAKKTGTGSALGEFCDHYLDAFNNGVLMLILFNLFGITNPWLVSSVIVLSYFAHVSVFYEQFKTGWLIFEKVGSLEGVLLSAFLILLAFIESIYMLYITPILYGFSVMEVFLLLICVGAIFTFIKTVNRTPNVRYSIWMYVILSITIGITSSILFNYWATAIVLTLYSSLYLGKIMMGHLIDGIERSPGLFTPLFLVIIYFMPDLYAGNTFLVIAIYLIANIIILIYRSFQSLGQFWVWVNPRKL